MGKTYTLPFIQFSIQRSFRDSFFFSFFKRKYNDMPLSFEEYKHIDTTD